MLSPTPLSLFCALLLCFPLAIVFTIITPPTTTTTAGDTITPPPSAPTPNITSNNHPVPTFRINIEEQHRQNRTAAAAEEDGEEQLLRRAARANPNPSFPRKLAFMFLTTISPLPFAPIWEMFFNQTKANPKLYNIYIHADPTSHPYTFSGVFKNRVIPDSKPTRRYSPTLTSAARRLLSHALLHDPSNSMFALLSPSCIPLHSFNYTYNTLLASSNKSFIEILRNEPGAYDRWAARGEHAMLPELPFDEFRIGSQFFVLTRMHARVVVSDRRLWSKFKLPCMHKYTCYPEEHYFATLMSMNDPRGCVPATLTHVDWRGRHDGHPRTYKASEVGPELILALRKDKPRYGDDDDDGVSGANGSDSSVTKRRHPFLFARKFAPDSIQPLMRIVNDVIFKD